MRSFMVTGCHAKSSSVSSANGMPCVSAGHRPLSEDVPGTRTLVHPPCRRRPANNDVLDFCTRLSYTLLQMSADLPVSRHVCPTWKRMWPLAVGSDLNLSRSGRNGGRATL